MDDINHGLGGYRRRGCRCDICKEANNESHRISRLKRFARLRADPTIRPHGVYNTYRNWGCRCPQCCAASIADSKKLRVSRGERGLSPRRERLLYNPFPGYNRTTTQPFGREWLDDDPVRPA